MPASITETTLNVPALREQVRALPAVQHAKPEDQNLAAADKHVEFWKPAFEKFDLKRRIPGTQAQKDAHEPTARRITSLMLTNALLHVSQAEAMTAGTDLPTFTRNVLLTVKRVYPSLFATQLFGTLPMGGPTGRLWFKDFKYDDSFTGSSPNVAAGDRTDDTTKFNTDYYAVAELNQARKLKFSYSHLDFADDSHRVVADLSDNFKDDAKSVYNDSAEDTIYDHMAQEMGRVIDRKLIGATYTNVIAANSKTWDATPADVGDGLAYEDLAPSEKEAYDKTLWQAIQTTISAIKQTRSYNSDGDPTWLLAGSSVADRLWKLTHFKPVVTGTSVTGLSQGALRDIGEITTLGIRVLTDPMLNSETLLFGRTPNTGDPAIYFAPYIPMQILRDSYDTDTGRQTVGVRSRFAVVKPNTGSNSASAQLSHVYGKLVVTA